MANRFTRKRLLALSAVAVLALAAVGGTALAGHLTGTVKSYTGCLATGGGTLSLIKEGDAPQRLCPAGSVEAHFSGGDISKIAVGPGLTLPNGGDNGEVTIQLDSKYSLPQSCTSGQVAKWNGTGWTCAVDNDTTYGAGTGLALSSGNVFSIAPAYQVKNTPDCTSGKFATGFDASGEIECSTPTAPSLQTFQARQANFEFGDGVPDDGDYRTYVTLSVPAGQYLVTGKGVIVQGDDDIPGFTSFSDMACRLGNLTTEFVGFDGKDNEPDWYPFALAGVVTTSGGDLTLQCKADPDWDLVSVKNATLAALKVG